MADTTLNEFIKNHSLAKQLRQHKADIVMEKFSNWLTTKPSSYSWHYSLYFFATESPLCYTDPIIIDEALKILNLDPNKTIDVLKRQSDYLSRAIFTLFRPSSNWQIEDNERVTIDSPRGIETFENIWHPEYIKYCEQIYNHIIRLPLGILEKDKNADYLSLALSLKTKKLFELGYPNITKGFDSVVRNAISHGGIEYGISEIHYMDKKEGKEIDASDVINLLDELSDSCHSIIAALLIFVINNQNDIEKNEVENLPLGINFLLSKGFADREGSEIVSFVRSGNNGEQLNINIKVDSASRGVYQLEALQAAWASCYFGGSNFKRFLVSVDCNKPAKPLIIINGELLKEAINNNLPFKEVAPKLFKSSLLWYDTPQFQSMLSIFIMSLKTNWIFSKRKFRLDIANKGTFLPQLYYEIVSTKNTSPKAFRRLEAHIVLDITKEITDTNLKKIIKNAIARLKRSLIKRKDIHGEFGIVGFPFNIVMRVYATNKRVRTLKSYSWQNEELVATAEYSKNWKIAQPSCTKEVDSIVGQIRIKYNPKLIKYK